MDATQFTALLQLLPPSTQLLVHLIGAAATVRLTHAWGGRTWKFTAGKIAAGQRKVEQLVEMVGEREAAVLTQHFGIGSELYVPWCDEAMRALRDAALVTDFDRLTGAEGYSERAAVETLAGQFQLSDRWVRTILKQPVRVVAVGRGVQLDLFGLER